MPFIETKSHRELCKLEDVGTCFHSTVRGLFDRGQQKLQTQTKIIQNPEAKFQKPKLYFEESSSIFCSISVYCRKCMILNTRGNPDFEHETEIQELSMDKPQPVEAESPLYSITWDPYLFQEFTSPETCPKNFILKASHFPPSP